MSSSLPHHLDISGFLLPFIPPSSSRYFRAPASLHPSLIIQDFRVPASLHPSLVIQVFQGSWLSSSLPHHLGISGFLVIFISPSSSRISGFLVLFVPPSSSRYFRVPGSLHLSLIIQDCWVPGSLRPSLIIQVFQGSWFSSSLTHHLGFQGSWFSSSLLIIKVFQGSWFSSSLPHHLGISGFLVLFVPPFAEQKFKLSQNILSLLNINSEETSINSNYFLFLYYFL